MKVFDENWFHKYQTPLLWLARSPLGNLVFRYRKMGHYIDRKLLIEIAPNSVTEFVSFKPLIFRKHYFGRNEYARKLYFALLPMWWAMHAWDWIVADHWQLAPQWSFGFSSLTANPASGTNSPVDGFVRRANTADTFANMRSGAGNDFANSGTPYNSLRSDASSDTYQSMCRNAFLFLTSSLGAGASIIDATFSWYGDSVLEQLGSFSLYLCGVTLAATNTLANADYAVANWGSTAFASAFASGSWSVGNYNDFALNTDGKAAINLTGITQLALRNSWDFLNSTTGLTWAANKNSDMLGVMAEDASNKPKLVINYTPGSSIKTVNGLAKASVKTVKGLAAASVKSINGLT